MTNNRDPREILSEYDMLSTVPGEIEDLEWGNEFVSEMATALSQTLEELAMFGDVLVVARNAPINFLQAERDALEAIVNEMRTKNDALKARCSEQDVDLTRCIERLERSEARCSKVEAERDLLTVMLIEQDAIKARCQELEAERQTPTAGLLDATLYSDRARLKARCSMLERQDREADAVLKVYGESFAKLQARCERYEKALKWYADPLTHLLDDANGDYTRATIPIIEDDGKVASEALRESGTEKGEG